MHFGFGMFVRNHYDLWNGSHEDLELGMDPDGLSMLFVAAVWRKIAAA